MTHRIVHAPTLPETIRLVEQAWDRYHASVAEHGPSDDWDNAVIRRVIELLVDQGHPFSANDMRPLLPEVRKCLISRRLIDAQHEGLIRCIGVTHSTLASTKGSRIGLYKPTRTRGTVIPTPGQDPDSELIGIEDLARMAGRSVSTVRWWVHTGEAPASVKVGRRRLWRRGDAQSWLSARAAIDPPTTARPAAADSGDVAAEGTAEQPLFDLHEATR